MRTLFLAVWDRLRSSLWFLPALMAVATVALSFATVALDERVTDEWLKELGWTYSGGAEGASLMLSTVAGSMIAIAGTVFSMTLVALSLASSQLGPGLLRNFMRDTGNQLVLGTFVATFLYCLLVLRTIRRADETVFVPQLSVSIAILLAIISLGVLIYFIHHVSMSIQTDEVIARVGKHLIEGIDRLFPGHLGEPGPLCPATSIDTRLPEGFEGGAGPVDAEQDGYLQRIDADALMALAEQEDLLLRLERRPGHYLVKGSPLVMVWPADRVTDDLAIRLNAAFAVGHQRTSAQDVEFHVNQLVEIAVRALSPGVNNPFAAIACVDRLGSGLCRLAERDTPSTHRFDTQGRLRLVAAGPTFAGILDASFNPIRQSARSNPAVLIRLLESIGQIAGAVHRSQDRIALARHATMLARAARQALPEPDDRDAVQARFEIALDALRAPPRRV
jgi:uncharacterized membrane protein